MSVEAWVLFMAFEILSNRLVRKAKNKLASSRKPHDSGKSRMMSNADHEPYFSDSPSGGNICLLAESISESIDDLVSLSESVGVNRHRFRNHLRWRQ